ncbi:MAG TPA: VTT domain-containing protein [Gemmatimonadaceae bacterium]
MEDLWRERVERIRWSRPVSPDRLTAEHAPTFRIRAVILVALVAGLLVLAWSDPVHTAVLQVFEAAKVIIQDHPVMGPILFVVLSALAAMLAFFSSAVLVPPAVYAWGPVVCAALLWAGWMLGGLASYGIAYRFGRPALRWLAPGKSISRYQERIREQASFGFILLFQLALPSEIPGLVLGLAHFPIDRYLLALAIAELPYAIGTTMLGASFLSRRFGLLLSLGALAIIMAVVLGRAFRRRLAGTTGKPA